MSQAVHIMLVEDNVSDQVVIERALEDGEIKGQLSVFSNGQEALDFLHSNEAKQNMPNLILMDINMPILNGKQTLQAIRAHDDLKHLPIVMLTTSSRDKDVIESYRLGVNAYLTKPVSNVDLVNTIRQLEKFWFDLVVLPNR